MLRQLLQCIADDGTCLTRDLAQRLGVSEALVTQMMDELARQGYLHQALGDGGKACCCVPAAACDRCALHDLCTTNRPSLWALTAKGWRFVQARPP